MASVLLVGCQTLREASQLRKVQFRMNRLSDARLADIPLRTVDSYEDLSGVQIARLASRLSQGELPLSFVVDLEGTNPEGNEVDARMSAMDWTLLLEEKETVRGRVEDTIVMPAGEPTAVPIEVSVNLLDVFDESLRQLVERSAEFGEDRPPPSVALQVQPTIQTPVGPIQYPSPISVGRVGGE